MKKMTLFVCLLSFSFLAFADSRNFKFVYQGLDFYIPEAPKSAGFLGTSSGTIIFKYGDEPGENLIGFSVEKDMETGGCEPVSFFKEVVGLAKTGCDELAVESFRRVFVDDREVGTWSGDNHDFFYFIGNKKSTIFFASGDPETRILKVDTNFLTKNLIKQVFNEHLN